MPPKKKRKLQESFYPSESADVTSGKPSTSNSDTGVEEATAGWVAASGPLATGRQLDQQIILGFVSQQELAKHARALKLKRVMLADLKEQSDLNRGYIGGQVMGHHFKSFSQCHDLVVFIQDESTSLGSQPKHLMVTIGGSLASDMPTLRDDAKLFLYNAVVKEDTCDFSQDHGKCLLVEGEDVQVWIVHKDVRRADFFKSGTCGKKWWAKTKQTREKLRSELAADTAGSSSKGDPGPSKTPSVSDPSSLGPPSTSSEDLPGPSSDSLGTSTKITTTITRRKRHINLKKFVTRSVAAAAESASDSDAGVPRDTKGTSDIHVSKPTSGLESRVVAPMSENSSLFPDNPDFPDSAFIRGSDLATTSASDSSESDDSSPSGGESDVEWNRRQQHNPGFTGRTYKYKKLSDLKLGDSKVNIMGVVKEFKPPSMTRGSDYYSTLTILDESDPRVGMRCVLFNRAADKLPQVKQVGDIICLHRVAVNSYNCQLQLQGVKFSSNIRFSGAPGKKIVPCTSSVTFTCTRVEKQRVKELRLWAKEQRKEAMRCLKAVVPGDYFDLACQVVSVTISKIPRCTVLTVWDATARTLHCKKLELQKMHEEGYPIVKDDLKLSEDSEGYQVHVVVYHRKCRKRACELLPGQFVHLQSLHTSLEDSENSMEIAMHEESKIVFDCLPPRIDILGKSSEMRAALEERIGHSTEAVTTTYHHDQSFSTVADMTGYAGPLPAKFRCRVKVRRISSPSLEDMVLVQCNQCYHMEVVSPAKETDPNGVARNLCTMCLGGNIGELPICQFYFKMFIGDRTGSVEVEVPHSSAVQLFNNLRPNNFYLHQELRYQLLEKLHALTGGNPPFGAGETITPRPRPWVEGCVMATLQEATVHYFLFDTVLKQNT